MNTAYYQTSLCRTKLHIPKSIRTIFYCLSVIGIALFATVKSAQSQPTLKKDKISFNLPNLRRSKFYHMKDFSGKQSLIVVFDQYCLACVDEIKNLSSTSDDLNEMNIVLISTSPPKDTIEFFHGINFKKLKNMFTLYLPAQKDPRRFLRRMGNTTGVIPYNIVTNQSGEVCMQRTEILTRDLLLVEIDKCN